MNVSALCPLVYVSYTGKTASSMKDFIALWDLKIMYLQLPLPPPLLVTSYLLLVVLLESILLLSVAVLLFPSLLVGLRGLLGFTLC